MNSVFCSDHQLRHCTPDTTHANTATMRTDIEDDDCNVLPLELDGETIARLLRLARACGEPPAKIASSLLHDLLADDEAVNVLDKSCLN